MNFNRCTAQYGQRNMITRFAAALAMLLCVSGLMCGAPAYAASEPLASQAASRVSGSTAVVFKDPQVEKWIRAKYIKKSGKITVADMKKMTQFIYDTVNDKSAKPNTIQTLDDLRYCVNLKKLECLYQPVTSIECARGMSKLAEICIMGCKITSLAPLAGKKYLASVWISGNPISDASQVLSLPSLREFNAYWGTNVTDISALKKTNGLTEFYCPNVLSDYSPLYNHKGLRAIALKGLSTDGFAVMMGNFKKLTAFDLDSSPIGDASLKLLKGRSLYRLEFNNCGLKDISGLSGMVSISDLRLDGNQIEDISPLAKFTKIDYFLNLAGNPIKDFSPLRGMKKLKSLYVTCEPDKIYPVLDELEKNGCQVYRIYMERSPQ